MARKKRTDKRAPMEISDSDTADVVGGLSIEPVILDRTKMTTGFQEPLVGLPIPRPGAKLSGNDPGVE